MLRFLILVALAVAIAAVVAPGIREVLTRFSAHSRWAICFAAHWANDAVEIGTSPPDPPNNRLQGTPSGGVVLTATLRACSAPPNLCRYAESSSEVIVSSDFAIEPGITFGAWLHAQVAENAFFERNGFMPDRVRRVAEQLQRDRDTETRLSVEVPWLRAFTAFTAPGRFIYFSRHLLERCPDDETTAFVIAHEIAHHDLGHLEIFGSSFGRHAARLRAGSLAVLFFRVLQKRIYSPKWEIAADRRALELCISAGYDPYKSLRLFDVLERWSLDYGDLDGVYGLDPESDDELSAEASLFVKARIWVYQRQRGYLPIQDRRALLRRHLESLMSAGPNNGLQGTPSCP